MSLEKTQARADGLALANEGRLYTDPANDSYWVGSELSDTAREANEEISTAVGELRADGDLEPGPGTGPNDLTPMVLTETGQQLFDAWSQS
jgi:hypothetical protein